MVFRAPLEALIVLESGSETENGRGCVTALTIILTALAAVASYLLGSIPSALIAARLAGRPDPRTVGTGNAGSTNVALTVGPAAEGAATTLGGYLGVAPALGALGLACWGIGLITIRRGVISTVTAIVALAIVTVVLGEHQLLGVGAAILTVAAHRTHLAAWRRGEMPTIREALRDNRRQ